jgi:signal transduction histidine kinase
MRIAKFILNNMESILQEWEAFARTVDTSLPKMDAKGLRNHAEHILKTAARDMVTRQTPEEQTAKSQGLGPEHPGISAATTHGEMRLLAGFTLSQMVSEYRALRATVLRLWLAEGYSRIEPDIGDIIRFNESIDQALAESIDAYQKGVDIARETILGVLGHDLRTPLAAAGMGAEVLSRRDYILKHDQVISRKIAASINRANAMVNDLLDLARSALGNGIRVKKQVVDLVRIAQDLIDEHRLGCPEADIRLDTQHSIIGDFDPDRMGQVFSNLISNAIHHGDLARPITVRITTSDGVLNLMVHNYGDTISEAKLPDLFVLKGSYLQSAEEAPRRSGGLGLGLYIASEIVKGHDGAIRVGSAEITGTVFEITMPLAAKT